MKYVIVIAGHRLQFREFVKTILARNTFVHRHPESVVVEGVIFKYVTKGVQLHGYSLSFNSELVKVGTWYELPMLDITEIELQFHARLQTARAKEMAPK